jgi:hypothetical protein
MAIDQGSFGGRQLSRGSLGAIGKPVTSPAQPSSRERRDELVDRGYGGEDRISSSRKRRRSGEDYGAGLAHGITIRAPFLLLAALILAAGIIKLGGCTMENALRALKLHNEQPVYSNPHFNFYQQ